MYKQTRLDKTEIFGDGTIEVRFARELVDDDGTVTGMGSYTTVCEPGVDIDARFAAENEHFTANNIVPVGPADIARVKALAQTVWTAEVISAYAEKLAALGPDLAP